MGYFYIAVGLLIVLMNVLTYRGVLNPQSLNGLRRRQPGDSDAAWRAGLRAAVPFGLTIAAIAMLMGALLLVVPQHTTQGVIFGGSILLVIAALLAIRRLDRTVKRVGVSE